MSTRKSTRGNIWAAVQARRILEFNYRGGHLVVEPYALGLTRRGNPRSEALICYQAGNSKDNRNPGSWRLLRTSEIKRLRVSTQQFAGDRAGYNPEKIAMEEIFCCVRTYRPAPDKAVKNRAALSYSLPVHQLYRPPAPRPAPPARPSHNELMQRFRSKHPPGLTALNKSPAIQFPRQTSAKPPRMQK
jgi:hypothetical protein